MSILAAISTVLASGVFAAIVSYLLNAKKENIFFLRKKSEELYLAFENYDRSLSSSYMPMFSLLKNEISYNEYYDIIINNNKNPDIYGKSLDAVTMLINIYFSNLKPKLDDYIKSRSEINKIITEHKSAYKQGDFDGSPWFNKFHKAVVHLEELGESMKDAIIFEATKLDPADQLWSVKIDARSIINRLISAAKKLTPKSKA